MNERDNFTTWERDHHKWMVLALLAMAGPDKSWDSTLNDIQGLPEYDENAKGTR
jgi:hypothetical protein